MSVHTRESQFKQSQVFVSDLFVPVLWQRPHRVTYVRVHFQKSSEMLGSRPWCTGSTLGTIGFDMF